MSTKVSNLNELSAILSKKERADEGILSFSKLFNIERLLKPFSHVKKKGYSLKNILVALILSRLGGLSVYAASKTGNMQMDDNTVYRLMNNQFVDWTSLLLSFAKQFIKCVASKSKDAPEGTRCFVIDDTEIEKSGKTFEGLSKIYSHKEHRSLFGFKLLLVCYSDGKSLVPCGLSLHREHKKHEYGLTKRQQARQFSKKRKAGGHYRERHAELDEDKLSVALKMLRRCVNLGIPGSYVLMDSWFVNDVMLQGIRKIRKGLLHVVGMCKIDARKFEVEGKERNSHTIIKMVETGNCGKIRIRASKKYKSRFFIVQAHYKGMPVKLYYIKYKRARHWTLLLTTDLSLSFEKAMELYQVRWSIEVLIRECKQYLRLGESQNTDFCGQIADATLAMITYTILTLYKRFEAYETMGELFRNTKQDLLEKTVIERIGIVILKILNELLEILSIDVEETMYYLMSSNKASKEVMILLNAVNQLNDEAVNTCCKAS